MQTYSKDIYVFIVHEVIFSNSDSLYHYPGATAEGEVHTPLAPYAGSRRGVWRIAIVGECF